MPELPEVETVRNVLKLWVNGKKIKDSFIYYNNVLENIVFNEFKAKIINQTIYDVERIGKHLIFVMDDYVLLSHLRMEGKYYLIENDINDEKINKHKIISFLLDDGRTLLYHDVRKFGKMKLLSKDDYMKDETLAKLGKEPFSITKEELFAKVSSFI